MALRGMSPTEFLQVILMAAAWGGSFLFLRMTVGEFGAISLIGLRVAIAGLVLLPGILRNPEWREQFRQNWFRLMVLGLVNAALPFTLFAYVTLFVSAGFASIINANKGIPGRKAWAENLLAFSIFCVIALCSMLEALL